MIIENAFLLFECWLLWIIRFMSDYAAENMKDLSKVVLALALRIGLVATKWVH